MVWVFLSILAGVLAIAAHDFFTGRRLLSDLVKEFRIWRADLDELDRSSRNNPDRSDAIVSLTSIPSRLPMIEDTLKSLLCQKRAPAEIRLYLPRLSRRENRGYDVPEHLMRLSSVKVIMVDEDLGPATKFIHALRSMKPDQKLIVVDDDQIYQDDLIVRLDDAADANPNAAFCLGGWVVPPDLTDSWTTLWMYLRRLPPAQVRPVRIREPAPIDILMGTHGFILRPRFVDLVRLGNYEGAPRAVFLADDVWISAHCSAPKFALPAPRGDFQPYRHMLRYDRSSIGWINRAGPPEQWLSTATLKHFGPERWLCGTARRTS